MRPDPYVLAVIETLFELLDSSPLAIVLLDAHRRIVYGNGRAAILDQRRDGISLSGTGIALSRRQDHTRLQGLIGRALDGDSPASVMRAARPAGKRPYGMLIARVPRRQAPAPAVRAVVSVVITDPEATRDLSLDHLHAVYGLTEAEARLAVLLAAGEDLRSSAKALGITYGTVRARLAEVFQKTETRRQGELINLLLTTLY